MYSLTDVNEQFYNTIVDEIKERGQEKFQLLIDNFDIENCKDNNFAPGKLIKTDPAGEKEKEFKYPFSYHIRYLYAHATGHNVDHNKLVLSLNKVKNLIFSTFMGSTFYQKPNETTLHDSKIGFLISLVETRLKLEEGQDLNAKEIAILSGLTYQSISHKIKNEEIDTVTKRRRRWIIKNEEVCAFLKNREDIGETRDYYSNIY